MKTFLLLFLLPLSALAAKSELSPELKTFLGAPPPGFEKNYLKPARQLRKALDNLQNGKTDLGIKELGPLSAKGEMAEHATFELLQAEQKKKLFAKSTTLANRMLYEFPSSPYREELDEIIADNDCQQGLAEAKAKKPATALLQRCLQRFSWKEWAGREEETEALYSILKAAKSPLFGPFVAELIQALPSSAPLRAKIQKEVPDAELRKYANIARFRTKSTTLPGVKPTYPDLELFEKGMVAVLEGRWPAANDLFKQVVADYSQSEHFDRAVYWIARSEEALGNTAEAQKRYEQIYNDYPLTYYGLQAALRLKKDLASTISTVEAKAEPLQGTLLPRQALALWRIRALVEAGLIDQARVEAKALFQFRPGGFTFGQESPAGAALTGLLFHNSGYSLAAFSHAYAAISLDPTQLNTFTLGIIFPSSFAPDFEKASESSGIHPLLLLSLSKQESAFLPNARSRANAFGLMQLLLPTAREMEPKLSRDQLFDPTINTRVGSRYLQKLIDRFGGNIPLALAGYNAGPSRASQWQRRMNEYSGMKATFDVDTFIDTIPFTETRRYVASILRNYAWYKLLNKDGTIQSVEELAFQWQRSKKEIPPPPAPVIKSEPKVEAPKAEEPKVEEPKTEELPLPSPEATPAPTPGPTAI